MEYSKNFGFFVIKDFRNDNKVFLNSSSGVVDHNLIANFNILIHSVIYSTIYISFYF